MSHSAVERSGRDALERGRGDPERVQDSDVREIAARVRDLVRLRAFLGEKNAVAAERAAVRNRQAAAALREQPELGRIVEGEAFRDLVAPFGGGAYVLRYRIDEDVVVIAGVWHGREDRE